MEVLSIAVPLTGEELAQQMRNGKAIFSTKLGRFPSREARPREVPIMMRSDPDQDIEMMISRLRRDYPRECRQITVPINNMYDYFDHYDVHLHGTHMIHNVLTTIATYNANRANNVAIFAESWKYFCEDKFLAIGSETKDLFTPEEAERFGNDFLEEALAYLKHARMAMNQVVPSVPSGFVPSAAGASASINDPAIIASQVSRHSSGQSSTPSAALQDPTFGQRHASVHSEPENKILRSIRPSLLRNSSNPEGLENTTPLLANLAQAKSFESRSDEIATNSLSAAATPAIPFPKQTFAEKIYAGSAGRTTPIIASQNPAEHSMDGARGPYLQPAGNSGPNVTRGLAEMANSRSHGQLIGTAQGSQRHPPTRTNGVQTMGHFDRQKTGMIDRVDRRLSGIAPPPPPHQVEAFPVFSPFVVPNQPVHMSEMYGAPRPIINLGAPNPSFQDRQYRGFGIAETGMAPQSLPQRPANANFPGPNNHFAGSALSVAKTRLGQPQVNSARVPAMDPYHGPPIAVRLPPGNHVASQIMPSHLPPMAFSNDARVIHDAQVAASQQAWQQQMKEQAILHEAQSNHRLRENNRPSERGDRRFSHKRGQGNYPRNRFSPTQHQPAQLDLDRRESGKVNQIGGNFGVSPSQPFSPKLPPDHHGRSLQGHESQNQRHTWKQLESPQVADTTRSVSPRDEHLSFTVEQPSWNSASNVPGLRTSTWTSSEGQRSDEALEPDKLYISGPGITEADVHHLIEPLAKITFIKAGNLWRQGPYRPFFFVSFATEEEARRVEAALHGHALTNPHGYLAVKKARVPWSKSQQYDRNSEHYSGSRAYPSSQTRNRSSPHEAVESRSQTLDEHAMPQTPKKRYQNSDSSNENASFTGSTVRRKKPSKTSVKTIAEESPTLEPKHFDPSTRLDNNRPASNSQARKSENQKRVKEGAQGRGMQPSVDPIINDDEPVLVTPSGRKDQSGPQNAAYQSQSGNQHSTGGQSEEGRTRPVSLGDFMHTSALQDSPERSSDTSQHKVNDGSPSRKPRNQSGSIRSKPNLRKESFPALDAKLGTLSEASQEVVEPAIVNDTVGKPASKGAMSKHQEPPNTPKVSTARKTVSSAVPASTSVSNPHKSATGNTYGAVNVPKKTERSTSANPAVSALVSESWANELSSAEDVDVEPVEMISLTSKGNQLSLESSNRQIPATKSSQITGLAPPAEDTESPEDGGTSSAVTIEEEISSRKPAKETNSLVTMAENADITTSNPGSQSITIEMSSTSQPSPKKHFCPAVPPRKHHSHEMSKGDASMSDSATMLNDQAQPKAKQNKKKKGKNQTIIEDHSDAGSAKETDKDLETIDGLRLISPSGTIAEMSINELPTRLAPTVTNAASPMTSPQAGPTKLFGTQTPLPQSDALPLDTRHLEPLEVSEGIPSQPMSAETGRPSQIIVPPRTSSIAPSAGPISTHKKKQKTPTKAASKRTKRLMTKNGSMATQAEADSAPKSGDALQGDTQNEAEVGWRGSGPQPEAELEVSHLKDPDDEEIIDVSDQCTRRSDYPSVDPKNAIYCVRGPTRIERSDLSYLILLLPKTQSSQADEVDQANILMSAKEKVDIPRLNEFTQLASDSERSGEPKDEMREEKPSELGLPQLSSPHESALPSNVKTKEEKMSDQVAPQLVLHHQSTSVPKGEPDAQVGPKKGKKKSNKKKKKTKTASLAEIKPRSSASEMNTSSQKQAESVARNKISETERFVADPESYAQEILSMRQESERPAPDLTRSDTIRELAKQYYEEKDGEYARELAKKQDSLGMDPYSPNKYRYGSSMSHKHDSDCSTSQRPTVVTSDRKIELLNTPTYPDFDKNVHGLGITTSVASTDLESSGFTTGREMMTHKGIQYDKFSDPPLTPLTSLSSITTGRPTPTTSDSVRTPSDSTSSEMVIADIRGADLDIQQLRERASKESPTEVKDGSGKFTAVEKRISQQFGLTLEDLTGSGLPPAPPPTPRLNQAMDRMSIAKTASEMVSIVKEHMAPISSASVDYFTAIAQMCNFAINSGNSAGSELSPMLEKWALAEEIENGETLGFPKNRLREEHDIGEPTDTKLGTAKEGEDAKDADDAKRAENDYHDLKDEDLENYGKTVDPSNTEFPKDMHPESLFFPGCRVVSEPQRESSAASDMQLPTHGKSLVKMEDDDCKEATIDAAQYQTLKDATARLSKEMDDADLLATFVSEFNFEIDLNDPMVKQITRSAEARPVAAANAKDEVPVPAEQIKPKAKEEDVSRAAILAEHDESPADCDPSKGLGRGQSLAQDLIIDMTGRASPSSSHSSDIVDAKIVDALKSLPTDTSDRTLVKVVNKCMGLDQANGDAVKQELVATHSATVGSTMESIDTRMAESRSKRPLKKRSKKALTKSPTSERSTLNQWAHFAANAEKDEAAQRNARQQEQVSREAEDARSGVAAPQLDLIATSETWRKVKVGETGHRQISATVNVVNQESVLDITNSESNSLDSQHAITGNQLDKASNESSAPTSEDDSEITLKPSRSPDFPLAPVLNANIDAVLANAALDTIPESAELKKSKTLSVSPTRVAALRASSKSRSINTPSITIGLNTSFPTLPPPSFFALSGPSSPVEELSEDMIARHNNITMTPQRRHRGSSSIHSEYSTTSSAPNTTTLSNPTRRPHPPAKEPSWSNIAASPGSANIRLSPSRNPSTRDPPAPNSSSKPSLARRITRSRADTRSSLAQSVTSRDSDEEDTPRRGRSTTPAGSQKGSVRRQGTAPKRGRDEEDWSVKPGEKMWGSSSEA